MSLLISRPDFRTYGRLLSKKVTTLQKNECRKVIQLLEIEWGERVTKLARMVLVQKRYDETKNFF